MISRMLRSICMYGVRQFIRSMLLSKDHIPYDSHKYGMVEVQAWGEIVENPSID